MRHIIRELLLDIIDKKYHSKIDFSKYSHQILDIVDDMCDLADEIETDIEMEKDLHVENANDPSCKLLNEMLDNNREYHN